MNDLISRQAAIEALNASMIFGRCNEKTVTFKALEKYAEGVWERIEALPSAQPEIIRCKDCRNNHWCNIQEAAMAGDNFFCGAAERRTDE